MKRLEFLLAKTVEMAKGKEMVSPTQTQPFSRGEDD
jgi:hypothetical protein